MDACTEWRPANPKGLGVLRRANLRLRRLERGVTVREVARMTGVPMYYVALQETGRGPTPFGVHPGIRALVSKVLLQLPVAHGKPSAEARDSFSSAHEATPTP